jgi:hypothetical protein
MGVYPIYLYINGMIYERKTSDLQKSVSNLQAQNAKLQAQINNLKKKEKAILAESKKFSDSVKFMQKYIKGIYTFKYSYLPKSSQIVDITLLMNKNGVYLKDLNYSDNIFTFNVFSFKDIQIPNFLDDLVRKGFNVQTEGVKYDNKKYNATIRIKE